MRHKAVKKDDDGEFLEDSGGGGDFEELWKSIKPSK